MTSFVFIYVCLSMENEQPADLFSLTLLNWCASWPHCPFLNLLYLLDFLIMPTQIDLVYRVYMVFQVSHESLIAYIQIIKTLSNARPIYRISHTIKYHTIIPQNPIHHNVQLLPGTDMTRNRLKHREAVILIVLV